MCFASLLARGKSMLFRGGEFPYLCFKGRKNQSNYSFHLLVPKDVSMSKALIPFLYNKMIAKTHNTRL